MNDDQLSPDTGRITDTARAEAPLATRPNAVPVAATTDDAAAAVMWRSTFAERGLFDGDPAHPAQPLCVPLPNAALREASSVAALDVFLAIGEAWAGVVSSFLVPHAAVLDIGCACGKLARFLRLRPDITYLGIDLFRPAIEWCQQAFSPITGDRFQFRHFDGYSSLYNPTGKILASEYRFPVQSHSIDCVVAASLFTHLLLDDCRHYLREIARVLSGRGYAILSIHTDPPPGQEFAGDAARIDMLPEFFTKTAAAAGLELFQTVGRVYGQDVFVFQLARDGQ